MWFWVYTRSIIHLVFIFVDPRYELTLFFGRGCQLFQYHLLKKAIHFYYIIFLFVYLAVLGLAASFRIFVAPQEIFTVTGGLQEVHRVGLVAPGAGIVVL